MSTHPNVLLVLALTPDDLTRRTFRNILTDAGNDLENLDLDNQVAIGSEDYFFAVMENNYNDTWQITAKEGDIIFFDTLTYGCGDVIDWQDLEQQKNDLEEWAKVVCEKHHCSYRVFVTANYW